MPYRRGKKWQAAVMYKGKRHFALFSTKGEASTWETEKKQQIKVLNCHVKPEASFEFFKNKYKSLYENPINTIADMINMIMTEMELPFRYRDLLALTRDAYERKHERVPAKIRVTVLERDNRECQICGATVSDPGVKLAVDHIIPKSKGGLTELRNLRTLCFSCNAGKGNHLLRVETNLQPVYSQNVS